MRFLIPVLVLMACSAQAKLELKYLSHIEIPFKQKFEKTIIGGLSGIYFDSKESTLFAVSDDRGNMNEPRIYQLSLKIKDDKISLEPKKVLLLKMGDKDLSHSGKTSAASDFAKVIDMEGIAKLPWGDFLLTNEGDLNRKPRVLPQLFSANAEAVIQRQFELPPDFLPELQGKQQKGIRNNLGFEGLAASPDGKHWLVATEANLLQDPANVIRWIQYEMMDAFVLKPKQQFKYPLESADGGDLFQLQKGVSEVTYLDSKRVLALERYLRVNSTGIDFSIKLYLTTLETAKNSSEAVLLKKDLILDMSGLKNKLGSISNFEAMTLGPVLEGGRKTLILVSDDNFKKEMKTQVVLLEIKE